MGIYGGANIGQATVREILNSGLVHGSGPIQSRQPTVDFSTVRDPPGLGLIFVSGGDRSARPAVDGYAGDLSGGRSPNRRAVGTFRPHSWGEIAEPRQRRPAHSQPVYRGSGAAGHRESARHSPGRLAEDVYISQRPA